MQMKQAIPVWNKELADERNILLAFDAVLPYTKGEVKIALAADALYRLFINGKMICHGPQRCGRGWWRKDELDITGSLHEGENTIEIWVQSYRVLSFEYVDQPGFLQAEVQVDGTPVLLTGRDFRCRRVLSKEQKVERYSYQRPFIEVWHLPVEYSEELPVGGVENIRLCDRTAPLPRLDYVKPEKMIMRGTCRAPKKIENKTNISSFREGHPEFCYDPNELDILWKEILNHLKNGRTKKLDEPFSAQKLAAGEFFTVKFPHEDTGFVTLKVSCKEDTELWLTFDETLTENDVQPVKRSASWASIIPLNFAAGKHEFITLEPRVMQYLKVICAKGEIKVEKIGLTEYVNSAAREASFTSSDEALNRIYQAAVNTFEQNAVDIFMDCPSRERAGWLCDSFFTSRTEKDLTGHSNVERGFLENFFIATEFPDIAEGMLPMCYPSTELTHNFIPNWAMFLVVELEEYLKRSGDENMKKIAKKRLYELENYFCGFLNKDGLLENLKGWVFVEWSQANKWVQNVNFPSNMMYYAMLKAMARIYGDRALDVKAEKLRSTICRLSFNGTFFRDHMVYDEQHNLVTPEDITEVCQYYAFFTGVADKENYPELLEIIAKDFGAGHKCEKTRPGVFPANAFIGNYLRMEVLSANGYRGQILGEIKEYFDYMALRTGTLWENDTPSASCNHGFASHAVRMIFRDCLGIDAVDDLNHTIKLNNDFTCPENAKAVLPLANGKLTVTVENGVRKVRVKGAYKIV